MAKVTIGGEEIDLPPLTFKALKKVWPKVKSQFAKLQAAQTNEPSVEGADSMFDAVDDALFIIAAALAKSQPALTYEALEDVLLPKEAAGLAVAVNDLMIESELVKVGKLAAAPAAESTQGSTTTGTPS